MHEFYGGVAVGGGSDIVVKTSSDSIIIRFIIKLCFIVFGISAYANPADKYNISNIVFGALMGLFFGYLFRTFIKMVLKALNSDVISEYGKNAISSSVEKGMVFIVPFCAMALLAVFAMNWSATAAFVSAGIMTAGASASIEIGKIRGKQQIKNTIASSVISWIFSTMWIFSIGFLSRVPMYAEGIVNLLKVLLGGSAS